MATPQLQVSRGRSINKYPNVYRLVLENTAQTTGQYTSYVNNSAAPPLDESWSLSVETIALSNPAATGHVRVELDMGQSYSVHVDSGGTRNNRLVGIVSQPTGRSLMGRVDVTRSNILNGEFAYTLRDGAGGLVNEDHLIVFRFERWEPGCGCLDH